MSDYSFSSEGMSSEEDRDSYASEISAFNSGASEPEHESEPEVVQQDAPISATTRSSRRRSARISSEPLASRPPKIVVIDDSDASDFEEERPSDRPSRPQRQRPRKVHRSKRTLPLALVPEDVPWKQSNVQFTPDPDTVEDTPSVAFIVIFINTFGELFADLPPYGPQDIERGVKECTPAIELLFLRLLGMVLNRKKEIERGRYSSALSELHALLPVLGVGLQFPLVDWKSKTAFEDLAWDDRLEFLHVLIHWALANSERVRLYLSSLGESSTMPWIGTDNENCRYYLVRGESLEENRDTEFRVYRETNRLLTHVSWRAVAATPQEVSKLAAELQPQGKSAAKLGRLLADLVSELEESDDRRFKEARRQRRRQDVEQQTMQVLQGEGRYSGRTRGKRVDYSQLAYDRELDAAMHRSSRRSGRVDGTEEWSDLAQSSGPTGDRQSRRLRGEVTMDIEQVEKDLEAAEARGRKRGREQAEKERQEQELLEEERLRKEQLEKEQLEKEQLEKERLEKERLEKERLERERLEKEQIRSERASTQVEPTASASVHAAQTKDSASMPAAREDSGARFGPNTINSFRGVQQTSYQGVHAFPNMNHSSGNIAPGLPNPGHTPLQPATTTSGHKPHLAPQSQTISPGPTSPTVNALPQLSPIQVMNQTHVPAPAAPHIHLLPREQAKEQMMPSQWSPVQHALGAPQQPPTQNYPGLEQLGPVGSTNQAQHRPAGGPLPSHPFMNQTVGNQLMNSPANQPSITQQKVPFYPSMQMQAPMQYQQAYNFPSGAPNSEQNNGGSAQRQS